MKPVSENDALMELMKSIVRNVGKARILLERNPSLATARLTVAASRANPTDFFFEEIKHYVYAGDTALHVAAATYDMELAEVLISNGADVRAKNRRDAEPLHYATDGGPGLPSWKPDIQASMIRFLISSGANPNVKDKNGTAALHRAVRNRCTSAVRTLLDCGVDAKMKNENGSTPLHLAVQNTGRGGTGTDEAKENQKQIIELLLAHGAGFNNKDGSGRTVRECISASWLKELYP